MGKQRSICVLDDDRSAAILAEHVLTSAGHSARSFTSASEAKAYINANRVDVIVVDLVMDELPGVDFMRWARSHNPFVRMIAMTGCASVQTLLECWRIGADCCVLKGRHFADNLLEELDKSVSALERWEHSISNVRAAVEIS